MNDLKITVYSQVDKHTAGLFKWLTGFKLTSKVDSKVLSIVNLISWEINERLYK